MSPVADSPVRIVPDVCRHPVTFKSYLYEPVRAIDSRANVGHRVESSN